MHPVDEFAHLKAEIHRLDQRASALREDFLQGGPAALLGLRSRDHEVLVREQFRRTILPDRLPLSILDDPHYWETRVKAIVTVRRLLDANFPRTRMRRVRTPCWQDDLPGLGADEPVVLIE